jgi:hypothetical protein
MLSEKDGRLPSSRRKTGVWNRTSESVTGKARVARAQRLLLLVLLNEKDGRRLVYTQSTE